MSASISQSLFVPPAPASKSGAADRGSESKTEGNGFADALDEAVAADAAPAPENSEGTGSGAAQSEPSRREPASASPNSSQTPSPETEAAALTADPALAPLTPLPTALVDPDTAATAEADGWPPPGLSSLFPDGPLFANPPSATVTVSGIAVGRLAPQGGGSASGSAPILSMAAETLPLAPLPAEPLGPGRLPAPLAATQALPPFGFLTSAQVPDSPSTILAGGITAGTLAAASGCGPMLSMQPETLPLAPLPAEPLGPGRALVPLPATAALAQPRIAALPDAAIATALARQPAALLLPNLDDDARALGAIGDAAALERSADGPSPFGFGPLTGSAASGSRLDLSQAFPTPVPMPSPKFAEDLGARLQWMAGQQGGDATLRIAPDGLGPVEIRLRLDGDRVELGFLAAQQDTRQALQDALPKLREMLAQQGLQLGHADVGQRQSSGTHADGNERRTGLNGDEADETRGVTATTIQPQRLVIGAGRGVLDLYA